MLVHHDDAVREFAWGPEFADRHVQRRLDGRGEERNRWTLISMKKDWKQIFEAQK